MKDNQTQYLNKSLEALFKDSLDAIVHIDASYQVIDVNQAFINLFGYKLNEIKGMHIDEVMNMGKINSADEDITSKILSGYKYTGEGVRYNKKGEPIEVLIKGIPILINGKMSGGYGIYVDITNRKRAEDRLSYMSFHDALTGVYNRNYLDDAIKRLDTYRQLPISIIMADFNGLKLINDTCGHSAGDEALKKAAMILQKSCRREDIIARWGGDEFVILLPRTAVPVAMMICKRINQHCEDLTFKDVPVSMALGTTVKTTTTSSLHELLCEAEDDMYKQKLTESRSKKSTLLKTLLKTLSEKSYETETHTQGMRKVAKTIGEEMNLPGNELSKLDILITLHDIGKINISEEILTKQAPLNEEEWKIIKKHPEVGYRIARATEEFTHVAEDILTHHERWDGSGYPKGLKGEEISLLVRITAIADAYEVMSNGRPYKRALLPGEIVAEFDKCKGTQFDPDLVDLFLSKVIS